MSTRRVQATLSEETVAALELRARANNRTLSEEIAMQVRVSNPRIEKLAQLQSDVVSLISDISSELDDLRQGTAEQFLRERKETKEALECVAELARGALNLTTRVTVAQLRGWMKEKWTNGEENIAGKELSKLSRERYNDDPASPANKIPHPCWANGVNSYLPEVAKEWILSYGAEIPVQLKQLHGNVPGTGIFAKRNRLLSGGS